MTDPVDTDALRERAGYGDFNTRPALLAAADEVDLLRAELGTQARVNKDLKRAADVFLDEGDRLRAIIENAPHWVSEHDADDCCGWYSDDNYCNCWKRSAL